MSTSKPNFVLCQDCLAISPFSLAKHNNEESCSCGGDWCGCACCAHDAQKLNDANLQNASVSERASHLGLGV
jgi:hypothetical protein